MDRNICEKTNATEAGDLTDAELAGVGGGGLTDEVKFFIAALASPAPYDPKIPTTVVTATSSAPVRAKAEVEKAAPGDSLLTAHARARSSLRGRAKVHAFEQGGHEHYRRYRGSSRDLRAGWQNGQKW
jgi:hypothetical protein